MKWVDFELCTDEDGDKYIQHTQERQTKTQTGTDPKNNRKFKPKAYNNKEHPNRCPVLAYEKMKANCPSTMMCNDGPFFLSINHGYDEMKEGSLMFKACLMGINHIYSLVKNMIKNSPLGNHEDQRKLTNHSIRKHLVKNVMTFTFLLLRQYKSVDIKTLEA